MYLTCVVVVVYTVALSSSLPIEFSQDIFKLVDYLVKGKGSGIGYEWLANITDTFGHRIVGSNALEDSIDYIVEGLKTQKFDNVHTEIVEDLPLWKRREEVATLLSPRIYKMDILGLGNTVKDGLTADVIVVNNFDELHQAGAEGRVAGKIVVYNEDWIGFGMTYGYRTNGASVASQYGAVATLIRSVTPMSVYSPHTASTSYSPDVPSIPTACITVEDAQMLHRMQARGKKLTVFLKIISKCLGKTSSRNTVFEVSGSDLANEIVLMSAHLDSWDVGQGAMDDGGGCAVMWQALNAIMSLGMRPRRTIRVVLWTAEEPGTGHLGSAVYYNEHKGWENETYVFVCESDAGVFKPTSLNATLQLRGSESFLAHMQRVSTIVQATGIPVSVKATDEDLGDVEPWALDGIPGMFYLNKDMYEHYFMFHHTRADTMSVLKPEDIDYTSAIFATFTHVIANMQTIS